LSLIDNDKLFKLSPLPQCAHSFIPSYFYIIESKTRGGG